MIHIYYHRLNAFCDHELNVFTTTNYTTFTNQRSTAEGKVNKRVQQKFVKFVKFVVEKRNHVVKRDL